MKSTVSYPKTGWDAPLPHIERWVDGVEIFGIQVILNDTQCLTEPLEMYNFPLPQEADWLDDVGIIDHPENIVISGPGFLFWYDLVKTTLQEILENTLFCVGQVISCGDRKRTDN